ncbi:MAG: hypothetical protein R2912_08125 [Eubacteriales bacterium]
MKRFAVLICMMLLCSLIACSGGAGSSPAQFAAQEPNATPAPSPAPETPRIIALFGAEDAAAFLSGLEQTAKDSGIAPSRSAAGQDARRI